MPATNVLPDANVRAASYHVARVLARCPNCGSPTHLLALALPRGHQMLVSEMTDGETDTAEAADSADGADGDTDTANRDGGGAGEALAPGAWQDIDAHAFLFYVEQISDEVRRRLQVLSSHFRFAHSAATHSSYWANHCGHCSALLEDHELHCEPDGPFSPASEAAAANIELLKMDEPLQAAAAGYTQEPAFFGSMRSA
jgi:hypothetical protein